MMSLNSRHLSLSPSERCETKAAKDKKKGEGIIIKKGKDPVVINESLLPFLLLLLLCLPGRYIYINPVTERGKNVESPSHARTHGWVGDLGSWRWGEAGWGGVGGCRTGDAAAAEGRRKEREN